MGLIVSVYRHGNYDCTNGGISSKAGGLCLVNVAGPFKPDDTHPAALLIQNRNLMGSASKMAKIVPAIQNEGGEWIEDPRWLMFGGNFAATSDGRFAEALAAIAGDYVGCCAIPIHDRHEP